MQLKTVATAWCVVMCAITVALAQESSGKLGERSAPANLESYADVELVLKNARHVIDALGESTFDADASSASESDKKCDSEDVQSFNRGFVLAHTGFNMFLALQESGFTDLSGANGLTGYKHRRFVQFGRSALLSAWTPQNVGRLLAARETLRSLPAPIKADLAAFLIKLREYRTHYARFKTAKPDRLEDLFRREDEAYYWYRASLAQSVATDPQLFAPLLKEMPVAINYSELSAKLDKELRAISDIAKSDPHGCFIEDQGAVIAYPSEKLKSDHNPILATKYMISFWRRRDMEGITTLADFAIGRVLDALLSN